MDHVILFRKVGKRKAAIKAEKSNKRVANKDKKAKKDPNKPKRPPSAFFVFLYASPSVSELSWNCFNLFQLNFLISLDLCLAKTTVRSSERSSKKKIPM